MTVTGVNRHDPAIFCLSPTGSLVAVEAQRRTLVMPNGRECTVTSSTSHKWLFVATLAGVVGLVPFSARAQVRYPPPYPYYGGAYTESSLRVVVKPSKASVYVDGYLAGKVDQFDGTFQRLHLESGQHEIVVYLAGYRSIRERLYFSPGQTRKITGTLEPLAAGEPDEGPPVPMPRAEAPDDRRQGQPMGRGFPPDGRPGQGPRRGPGQGPGPDQIPNPPPRSQVGSLSIQVQPSDADVLVDGQRWSSGRGNERLVIQLTEGRHVIEVSKPGYRRFTTEVELRAGDTSPLNVSLTPER
jgi:hypothetical protein